MDEDQLVVSEESEPFDKEPFNVSSAMHRQSLFSLSRKRQVTKQINHFELRKEHSPYRFKNSPLKSLMSRAKSREKPSASILSGQ